MQILFAQPIVDHEIPLLAQRVSALVKKGRTPWMTIVLVGENPASASYVKNKIRLGEKIGAKIELVSLPINVSVSDFQKAVDRINQSDFIHGGIIQLPLPAHLKNLDLQNILLPHKDLDGFHIQNIEKVYFNQTDSLSLLPCTPQGVLKILDFYKIPTQGKLVGVLGRSLIVGRPLTLLLTNRDATVIGIHSKSKNIQELCRQCDILIAAIGKPLFLDATYLRPSKDQILIDVGIGKHEGKLVGDIDFENVKNHCQAITPVPGGVGPMTVLSLIENLTKAAERTL